MPSMGDTYYGETTEYWLELKRQADTLGVRHLIGEIATLRAKVSYYESRISGLSRFMDTNLEVNPQTPQENGRGNGTI